MCILARLTTAPVAIAMTLGLAVAQEPAPGTQQPTIEELERRVAELEQNQAEQFPEAWQQQPSPHGQESQISDRGGLYDRQEAAARPGDITLDPECRGFMPVPNTPMFIRFNAKPRLDATFDNRNTGYRR